MRPEHRQLDPSESCGQDMFNPEHPYTGRELADALANVARDGSSYLASLGDSAFFAPQGNRWPPAGHVRHLRNSAAPVAKALRIPVWILRLRFGRPAGASRPYDEVKAIYQDALRAGGQAGRFAPSSEPPPTDPAARRAEIMAAWHDANTALDRRLRRWSERDLDRACLPHPLIGRLTVREMIAFTVYHTAHHLNRIVERSAAEDLPVHR
jgi:hypothetical protein